MIFNLYSPLALVPVHISPGPPLVKARAGGEYRILDNTHFLVQDLTYTFPELRLILHDRFEDIKPVTALSDYFSDV